MGWVCGCLVRGAACCGCCLPMQEVHTVIPLSLWLFTQAVGTFQKGAGNDWKNKSLFSGTKEILTCWSFSFLLFVYTALWWEQNQLRRLGTTQQRLKRRNLSLNILPFLHKVIANVTKVEMLCSHVLYGVVISYCISPAQLLLKGMAHNSFSYPYLFLHQLLV